MNRAIVESSPPPESSLRDPFSKHPARVALAAHVADRIMPINSGAFVHAMECQFMKCPTLRNFLVPVIAIVMLAGCHAARPTETIRSSGDWRFDHGDYAGAASEYGEIVARYPGDYEAQYKLGMSQLELKNYSAGRRALEIAYTLKPKDPKAAEALAEAMFRQGDEARLFAFLRSRAQETQLPEAYEMLAKYAMDLNDPDSAKTAIDTAISIDDGNRTEPYLQAAALEERLGHLDQAERRLRQAYGINPYDTRVKEKLVALNVKFDHTTALPPGR